MSEHTSYVLGFAFDSRSGRVLLVQKSKPEWQAGRWNGVGGKVEHDESGYRAMWREFEEETTIRERFGWIHFGTLDIEGETHAGTVHLYTRLVDGLVNASGLDDEPVALHDPFDLPDNIISNLRWLVPMASCIAFKTGGTRQIKVRAKYE